MAWTIPEHSRKRVRNAGYILAGISNKSNLSVEESREIVNNWRSAHAYPMHVLYSLLKSKAQKIQ